MTTATKKKPTTEDSAAPLMAVPADGVPSQQADLTRVLKTLTIGKVWEELAEHARDENWSHEEYLAAVLQRKVADRESAGTIMRIRTAHFPAVKTIEDFNLDHLPRGTHSAMSDWACRCSWAADGRVALRSGVLSGLGPRQPN